MSEQKTYGEVAYYSYYAQGGFTPPAYETITAEWRNQWEASAKAVADWSVSGQQQAA